MNRSEKKVLRTETQRFDSSIRLAIHSYSRQVEERMDREQEKLANLPDQIRDSVTGENIEETILSLGELSDKLEEIENALDDILTLTDASSIFKAPAAVRGKISQGRKGTDFHAILPLSLLEKLKRESTIQGLSMNEIVCRALTQDLDGEGNYENNSKKAQKVV